MKYNKQSHSTREYTTPKVKVLELLAEEASLLSESQLEDYDENILC